MGILGVLETGVTVDVGIPNGGNYKQSVGVSGGQWGTSTDVFCLMGSNSGIILSVSFHWESPLLHSYY
jgi:hypothetical protein